MARISSYRKESLSTLSKKDLFPVSSYEGEGQNGPFYNTKTVTLEDLSDYINSTFTIDGINYDLQSLTNGLNAQTSYVNNLIDSMGTAGSDGGLVTIGSSFANLTLGSVTSVGTTVANNILNSVNSVNESIANIIVNTADSLSQDFVDQILNLAVEGNYATVTQLNAVIDDLDAAELDITSLQTSAQTFTTNIAANSSNITQLQSDVTDVEGEVQTISVDVTSNTSAISSQAATLSSNTASISTNTTNISSNTTDITALQTRMTTAEADITQTETDVTTLQSSVTTNTTNIGTNTADIASNSTDITTNASNITSLQNDLDTAETDIAQAQTNITSLTSSVSTNATTISLRPKVFHQDDQPGTTEPVGSIWYDTNDGNKVYVLVSGSPNNSWQASADARIDTNATNITTNSTNISTNASDISTLENNLTTTNTNVSQNASDVTSLQTDVSTNSTNISSNTGSISTNSTAISTNASNITTLQNDLNTAEADITQAQTDITTLETDVATNETNITNNAGNISSNTSNISTNASNITTLQNDLNTAEADITQNASNVTSLTSTVSTNTTNIASNASNISSNTSSISTNTTNISTNASDITTLQNDLNTAEANITQSQTDITSLESDVSTNATNITSNGTSISTNTSNISTNATNITTLQNDLNTAEANITQNASDVTTLESDISTLETTVDGKPEIYRQNDAPAVTVPVGSLWFDTDDNNKSYVLVSGSPNTWSATQDLRISTNATNISSLSTRMTTAETDISAVESDVTTLNTDLDTANDSISTNATNISTLQTSMTTAQGDITAIETDVTTLEGTVDTNTGDISSNASNITTLSTSISNKPDVYRQDAEPATTAAEGSIWYDTNDDNKVYVLVDTSGTKSWEATDDSRLVTIPTIFRQNAEPTTTGIAAGSLWYDTNDENKLYVLSGGSWTETRDTKINTNTSNISTNTSDIADNVTALSQRSRVFRQDDEPGTTGVPANSLWYDTNDNNKLYVFNGTSWVLTDDSRIGNNVTAISNVEDTAETNSNNISTNAGKITEIESQFTFSGTDITGVADALSTSISNTASSAAGAVASDLDKLEAVFSFDANGDVTGTSGALSTAITTSANAAISNADLASASSVDELETQFTFNASNEITGVADALNSAISTAQSNAESSSATKIETLASNFFTGYDAADGSFTATSVSEAFANEIFTTTTNTDFASTTSFNTLSGRVDDTEADISTNASAIATVEGYAESRYSIQATAGNVVTGMSILAADGTTTDVSQVVFQTDKFLIKSSTTQATPFILDSGQLKLNVPLNAVTGTFSGTLSAASGNIGGWIIESDEIKSPAISGVNRVELDPSQGLIINDSAGDPKLQVRSGNLSSLDSLTTATFTTINNIQFASWSSNYTTIGPIDSSLYKTTGTTELLASFGSGSRTGSYNGTVTINALTDFASTSVNFSGLLLVELYMQIATDSSFNNVILNRNVAAASDSGAGSSLSFSSSTTNVSFNIVGASDNIYLRFYWKRTGYLGSGYITWAGDSFDVNQTNLSFAKETNQTELTDQGIQIARSADYYFRVDRGAYTSGDYVYIEGGLNVDGQSWDFTKYNSYTGSSSTVVQKHYQKLPSGMMIQWGYQTGSTEDVTVTFPLAFPNNCSSVGVTTNRTSKGSSGDGHAYSVGKSSFVAVTDSPNDFWWYALGW